MWVEHDIQRLRLDTPSSVTIGAFDGVHRGHQALIKRMVAAARTRGSQPLVVTFDPLPGAVMNREGYGQLSTLQDRLALIETTGVAGVVVLRFDAALMAMRATTFVGMLVDHLALSHLWIGLDFRLGRNREGTPDLLSQLGAAQGFEVDVFTETVLWEGEPVRSSRIRRALEAGDIEEANGCLGYPYRIPGTIGHGDERGRTLGFPTANLIPPEDQLFPANGVYVCQAHLATGTYDAITNVGTRPTFNGGKPKVEAYLLDFSSDIYGEPMHLAFFTRLRPEYRYPSAQALIEQMHRDEVEARAWLSAHPPQPDLPA